MSKRKKPEITPNEVVMSPEFIAQETTILRPGEWIIDTTVDSIPTERYETYIVTRCDGKRFEVVRNIDTGKRKVTEM